MNQWIIHAPVLCCVVMRTLPALAAALLAVSCAGQISAPDSMEWDAARGRLKLRYAGPGIEAVVRVTVMSVLLMSRSSGVSGVRLVEAGDADGVRGRAGRG